MARMGRVVLAGVPHHVTQRGVRSMAIFDSDADRREYLRLVGEQGERFGLRFLAYCLMTNHVHLVVVPAEQDSLARGIGEAHRLYTRMVNFRQGVRGYLFQGRFHSCALDEAHLVSAVRYVERNPVRAGLVQVAWEYGWSSARYHVGRRKTDPIACDAEELAGIRDWREFLRSDPAELALLRDKTRTGRPCGSEEFVRWAEGVTGRRLRLRSPGRPRVRKK
jgi:putative transposase